MSPQRPNEIIPLPKDTALEKKPRRYPYEKLDVPTQERIQSIVDDTLLHILDHLGIPRGIASHVQETLLHLNKVNVGKFVDKERVPYNKYFKDEIRPIMKQLEEDVQSVVSAKNWSVEANRGVLVGDMMNLILKNKQRTFRLAIYGRGFEVETPDFEAQLNTFPSGSDDPAERSLNTSITAHQLGNALNLPAPTIKIQSEANITGEGVLQYIHTDASREGKKPNVFHLVGPKKLMTSMTYSADGKPLYLRNVFPLPGLDKSLANTVFAVYDLRDGKLQTGMKPTTAGVVLGSDTFEQTVFPKIVVDEHTLTFEFVGQKDVYPLQALNVVEVTKILSQALKKHFY